MAMVTVFLGALMNVILNYWLIPIYGLQGAAFATAVSYVFIFLFRAVDTRRMVKIDLDIPKLLLNSALLGVQAALLLYDVQWLALWEFLALLAMFLVNLRGILSVAERFYQAFVIRRRADA